MQLLWFVPTIVLLAGAGAAWLFLRRIAEASDDVAGRARRLEQMGLRLAPVRSETRRARASIDRIQRRSSQPMFNVGGPEVMVILLVALIVLGPQQLPKAIRSVTNVMNELRKVSSGFQSEMQKVMDLGATDTTGREVNAEDRSSQPSPGPGSGATVDATPTTGRAMVKGQVGAPSTPAPSGTEPGSGTGPAAIDPADRAAG